MEDRTPPQEGLQVQKRPRGVGEAKRSLPKTLLGLSTGTESSRAGPLTKPGINRRGNVERKDKYENENFKHWDAFPDYLLSHVHPDDLRLWMEGAGQGGRLYLRQGLLQHSHLQQRTGVG